jgi:hypothetical protein
MENIVMLDMMFFIMIPPLKNIYTKIRF